MRNQALITLFVATLVAVGSTACVTIEWQGVVGSGELIVEEIDLDAFTGVELATRGDLHIVMGEEEQLRIEAEDNLLQYFQVEVRGDRLWIGNRVGALLHPTRPVNFYLTAKELDEIVVSGSGDVRAPDLEGERISVVITGSGDVETGQLFAEAVKLRIRGSGDLEIAGSEAAGHQITISGSGDVSIGDLGGDTVRVRISGSGNVEVLGGEVGEQDVTTGGSGDYEAGQLRSAEARVRISGSGSVTVQVDERLQADLSGSGDLCYVGSPDVKRSVRGSGEVARIDG